jgi:hypothetical protein
LKDIRNSIAVCPGFVADLETFISEINAGRNGVNIVSLI